MSGSRVALLGAVLVAACERPHALVICHNANCAEPTDPADDDTIAAMRASLAVELDGGPVIDGIEVDTFFRASDSACLYAHDLERDQTSALDPANELAAYFARPGPIAFGDGAFHVVVELKSHVSADTTDRHTPAQAAAHAACAWQVYDLLATAAVANQRDVVVIFEAFNPDLLRAVIDQTPDTTPVPIRYSAIQGIPAPLDDQTYPLGDYAGIPIDQVELHAQWILDGQYELARSMGLDLAVFMFSATVETFDVIERYEPAFVVTNEARLVRRWLQR